MPFLVPGSTGVREAYIISWVSLVLTVIGLIVGLVVSVLTKSSATLGFALENAVDGISSVLVLWRFWGGGKGQSEGALAMREKRASVGIAIVFVILAITVGTAGGQHLASHGELDHIHVLLGLAVPSVLIFGALGVVKVMLGNKTKSPSLKKDGACSLCGALLSLGVAVGAALHDIPSMWWFDGAVALSVAIALGVSGLYTLWKNARQSNAWWTVRFWLKAQVASSRPPPEHAPPIVEAAGPPVMTSPDRV